MKRLIRGALLGLFLVTTAQAAIDTYEFRDEAERERYRTLQDAMTTLSEAERVCLLLRSAGVSRAEIGVMTGLVGMAGGVGGFYLASSLGYSKQATGSYMAGFLIFATVLGYMAYRNIWAEKKGTACVACTTALNSIRLVPA